MNNEQVKRDIARGITQIETYDPTQLSDETVAVSKLFEEVVAENKEGMKENLEASIFPLNKPYFILTLGYYIGYASAMKEAEELLKEAV